MVTKEEAQVIVSPKDNLQQRLSSDSTVHASRNDREENVPIIPEKPSEDGYNWRKYGQKNVKGNEYIRSYYRCSYPNCQVRKQVERSHDGRITDITYLGKHDHARPHAETQEATPFLPVGIPMPDHAPSAVEDKPSDAHAPTTDNVQPQPMDMCKRPKVDKPDTRAASLPAATEASDAHGDDMTPKRRKKGVDDAAEIVTEKPTNESRVVIQTVSEVDIVNDGYRWRKYGQKMVKGNPNPRSYYRCSTAGCPVKKHVERASHDPKVVITTYEGQHDHTIPPIRTIVPQSGAPSGGKMESNGDSKSKSQENDAAQNGSTVSVAVKLKPTPPSTEEGNSTKEAVTIKTEISPTVQKTQHEPQKDDQMEESKHKIASNEEKMQDEPQPAASKSENTYNQSVKQEKADSFEETKAEAVSTEKPKAKEGDHIDFTGNEITSNVQQMEEADPISAAPSSIDTDNQNVKEEKPATIEEAKTEAVVSTEKQRPDAIKSEG